MILTGKLIDFDETSNTIWETISAKSIYEINQKFKNNRSVGVYYLSNIDTAIKTYTSSINITNVSHKIMKFHVQSDGLYCEVRVLDTSLGELLKKNIAHVDLYFLPRFDVFDLSKRYIFRVDIITDSYNTKLKIHIKK